MAQAGADLLLERNRRVTVERDVERADRARPSDPRLRDGRAYQRQDGRRPRRPGYARAVLTRRHVLLGGLSAAAACSRAGRPRGPDPAPHPLLGVQSGDATTDAATVWCRASRPGRLVVEWTTGDGFARATRVDGGMADPAGDHTAVADLAGLPPGARVRYRCYFRGPSGAAGDAVEGSLSTAPAGRVTTGLVWSGDVCGQGWGQDVSRGGYRILEAMARLEPELFVCSGDLVYADDPLLPEVALAGGGVWRNRMVPAKTRPAETLGDFRGNFAYNLEDAAFRRLAALTPIAAQWDDHEVRNNWFPGGTTAGDARYRAVHAEAALAAHARRAMFEYVPFGASARASRRFHRALRRGPLLDVFLLDGRSFRSANGPGDEARPGPTTTLLGAAQLDWLEAELSASRALWKVIACDLPIGLVVSDEEAIEAFAQGAAGPPAGRELEIARLLLTVHQRRVTNLVFLTADVHYPAAHLYQPEAARFGPFTPFHELVAGPLHAGGFGPSALDPTFGPGVLWQRPPPAPNSPPSDGYVSFGRVRIDAATGALEASWHGGEGEELHRMEIAPAYRDR